MLAKSANRLNGARRFNERRLDSSAKGNSRENKIPSLQMVCVCVCDVKSGIGILVKCKKLLEITKSSTIYISIVHTVCNSLGKHWKDTVQVFRDEYEISTAETCG